MSRRQKDPLRALRDEERTALSGLSRSRRAPAAQVAGARALLAVAEGQSYTWAARLVGRRSGDTVARWVDAVARWVADFNREGLAAARGWPLSCRVPVAVTRSAMARSNSGASWPKSPGRRTGRGMAPRPGH